MEYQRSTTSLKRYLVVKELTHFVPLFFISLAAYKKVLQNKQPSIDCSCSEQSIEP